MLNFSKIKILSIYLILILISFFSLLNFQNENEKIIDKQINLGLDLQGGSYLLLEIDTEPLIKERLQEKIIPIKKYLNENNLKYSNFVISNKFINFNLTNLNDVEKFEIIFMNFNFIKIIEFFFPIYNFCSTAIKVIDYY